MKKLLLASIIALFALSVGSIFWSVESRTADLRGLTKEDAVQPALEEGELLPVIPTAQTGPEKKEEREPEAVQIGPEEVTGVEEQPEPEAERAEDEEPPQTT